VQPRAHVEGRQPVSAAVNSLQCRQRIAGVQPEPVVSLARGVEAAEPGSDHIPAGHELDRFGSNGGSFLSDEGAPLSARGMPPGIASDYNNFVGTGRSVPDGLPWEVRFGPLKEAFGQPGGANQWVVIDTRTGEQISVDMLIKKRMISER
jgi:hypothetical protein